MEGSNTFIPVNEIPDPVETRSCASKPETPVITPNGINLSKRLNAILLLLPESSNPPKAIPVGSPKDIDSMPSSYATSDKGVTERPPPVA